MSRLANWIEHRWGEVSHTALAVLNPATDEVLTEVTLKGWRTSAGPCAFR